MASEREGLEDELRALHARGAMGEVTTRAIRAYGAEVLGFLANVVGTREEAAELFSQLCEDIWTGIPGFRFQCSLRTWIYTLARNAAHRSRLDPHRRRRVPISDHPELYELEQQVRTTTVTFMQTEVKDRVRKLREQLEPEERMLLVLRVDRDMAWNEIAAIMASEDAADDVEVVSRKAALLRKRFERVKERLRVLVARETSKLP